MSVVLPAPFGPSSPRISPSLTSSVTSDRAANRPYRLVSPNVSIIRSAICVPLRERPDQPRADVPSILATAPSTPGDPTPRNTRFSQCRTSRIVKHRDNGLNRGENTRERQFRVLGKPVG